MYTYTVSNPITNVHMNIYVCRYVVYTYVRMCVHALSVCVREKERDRACAREKKQECKTVLHARKRGSNEM